MKYSVDKIKLEFQFVKTQRIQAFLNRFSYSSNSDTYYMSNALTKCKHNFVFGEDDARIYLGVEPNWKNSDKCDKSVILEYNPNKVNPFLFNDLLWLRYYPSALIRVCSFDLAVDISVDYNLVRMVKRDTREKWCKIGKRYTETQYLGQLGHNHVKLYNKAVEQKVDVDWTRFEITVKKINSLSCDLKEFESNIKLPQLYCVNEQIDFEYSKLSDIQRIVLESIISDVNILYTIKDNRAKKKYMKLLDAFLKVIDISVEDMYKAYIDYTSSIFESGNYNMSDVDVPLVMSMNTIF